ncbi:MAG TPA: class I SAM-dependent methyltransferase [Phycisphaeraceae bacterium]
MAQLVLTQRQKREADFYRQYASIQRVRCVDWAPVQGREQRLWNPYWHVYHLARRSLTRPGQRLLDFGCGVGIAAVRLAYLGYQVDGFDLSEENLAAAQQLAQEHRLADRCQFNRMAAERLDYPGDHFDVVVGIDILHHVEIGPAVREARRVLKPGGVAIFKEHIEAPLIEPLRRSWLFQRLAPLEPSLEHHITPDERKLTRDDLRLITSQFRRVRTRWFTLLERLDRILPGGQSESRRGRLQRLDHRLLHLCPPMRKLAGTVVLICYK